MLEKFGIRVPLGGKKDRTVYVWVPDSAAERLIDAALQAGETAVTGYHMPEWMIQRADYVSVIQAEKHPFDTEGLAAREGIEW